MNLNTKEEVIEYLSQEIKNARTVLDFVKSQRKIDFANGLETLIDVCGSLLDRISRETLKVNYLKQLINNLQQIFPSFYWGGSKISEFQDEYNKGQILKQLNNLFTNNRKAIDGFTFSLRFFEQIGFLERNIVAIGANGSGKTSLADKLSKFLQYKGAVIPAQKALFLSKNSGVNASQQTRESLESDRKRLKSYKDEKEFNKMQNEFRTILNHLFAEHNEANNLYASEAKSHFTKDEPIPPPPETLLDEAIKIWNSLVTHRRLECTDGMNLVVKGGESPYPASKLSDGEKVILFAIGHVLLAPQDGFIVADEPEMFLHKTLVKKLWDILEGRRPDCIFLYLTHDLDFATSRVTSTKKWIKSYTDPDRWEIEDIPNNEIPEPLLIELLGSRKNILFCEGKPGSYDERLYNILFPFFTIKPLESCSDVINYTKAFNALPNMTIAAYGLIDSDYHSPDRLKKLADKQVYNFSLAEVENLFFDEDFLSEIGEAIKCPPSFFDNHKSQVINELDRLKEVQVANFVSVKIDNYFKESNVSMGANLSSVTANFQKFVSEIDIQGWYDERMLEIEEIVATKNYKRAIQIFNNKGLKSIANHSLKVTDFIDRSIRYLSDSPTSRNHIIKYFPQEIVDAGGKKSVED